MARDVQEFTEFVAARSSALLRTASLLAGDRHLGEELLQDAFAELYRKWPHIKEPAAREAYLRRIMVRTATRQWRARPRIPHQRTTQVDEPTVDHSADRVTETLDVWSFLAELPAQQRAVVVLRYYEDFSEGEIAAVMDCGLGTVRGHASRALHSLQRMPANPGQRPAAYGVESRGVQSQP